jgi:hypothetical protein
VAALPPVAFAVGGFPLTVVAVAGVAWIHARINPVIPADAVIGESTPVLNARQRHRRAFEEQV